LIASVIVCTFNRAKFIEPLFKSLRCQEGIAPADYEIVFVDNNSTDDTKATVDELSTVPGPKVRYCLEPRQGLSFARNRGAREARGEIIAFIDDDATAKCDWLQNLCEPYRSDAGKEIACVGGKILPVCEAEIPGWLSGHLLKFLGALDYGDTPRELRGGEHPYGGNISFRAEILKDVGLFSTRLGRRASSLRSNEEVEACLRLRERGWKVFYVPQAIVYHVIPKEHLTKRYFRRRLYWQGKSDALLALRSRQAARVSISTAFTECWSALRIMIRTRVAATLKRDGRETFPQQLHFLWSFGNLFQALQILFLGLSGSEKIKGD